MRAYLPLLATLLIAGCVSPPKAVAPQPVSAPPVPVAVAVPPPSADWRDWPVLPGSWAYQPAARAATYAVAGQPVTARLRCDAGLLLLSLSGAKPGSATVRTSSTTRVVALEPADMGQGQLRLPANDPLFDAIAFSRGRFVIEQGAQRWVLPAYAEVGRVIEDCR